MPSFSVNDYGIIANSSSAALINRLGSVDWCCFPFLDSPSHFGALLDSHQGGRFQISPHGEFRSEQRYIKRSLVLETLFETPKGRAVLTDWMPLDFSEASTPILYRRIDVIQGALPWVLNCDPRFRYGSLQAEVESHFDPKIQGWNPTHFLFRGSELGELAQLFSTLRLQSSAPLPHLPRSFEARFNLSSGQSALFAWTWGRRSSPPPLLASKETAEIFGKSAHFCPSTGCSLAGPWHDLVVKSGTFLRSLYSPGFGSLVNSLTTSIPSSLEGTQDERYSWLNSIFFSIQGFAALGMKDEAKKNFQWLAEIVIRDGVELLQPVYALDGGRVFPEEEVPTLKGFQEECSVRIGSHSAVQFNLGIYGQIFLATEFYLLEWEEIPEGLWLKLEEIANFVCGAWRRPDSGPWLQKGRPEHWVISKALCWVVLDRASRMAEKLGKKPNSNWATEMRILHSTLCTQGYNEQKQSFVRALGDSNLDASTLLLPIIGFLPIEDRRIQGTLNAMIENRSEGVLIYRGDQTEGEQNADIFSSFLVVTLLAMAERSIEASDRMAELCTYASPLGFFGEQINPRTDENSGNFPYSMAHLALIVAARAIGVARSRKSSLPQPPFISPPERNPKTA